MENNNRFCVLTGHATLCNIDYRYCKRCSVFLEATTDYVPEWKKRREETVKND